MARKAVVPAYKALHEQYGDFEARKYCLRTTSVKVDCTIVMMMMSDVTRMRTLNVVHFRVTVRSLCTKGCGHTASSMGGITFKVTCRVWREASKGWPVSNGSSVATQGEWGRGKLELRALLVL